MTIDPTRKEWLEERANLCTDLSYSRDMAHRVLHIIFGPCPPAPAPEPFRKGEQMLVCSGPGRGPGEWWVSIPAYALTPDEARAMADALRAHADYAREQGDDPWRSDEEAAALIDAIEPCGRGWPLCQRPKGHDGACASEERTAPKVAPQPL